MSNIPHSGEFQDFGPNRAVRDSDAGKQSYALVSPYFMRDWAFSHIPEHYAYESIAHVAEYQLTWRPECLISASNAIEVQIPQRVAKRCTDGLTRYKPRNWEAGMPISRTLDSFTRHALATIAGDTQEDHPGAMLWNLMAALHYHYSTHYGILPFELFDLPDYRGETDLPARYVGTDLPVQRHYHTDLPPYYTKTPPSGVLVNRCKAVYGYVWENICRLGMAVRRYVGVSNKEAK